VGGRERPTPPQGKTANAKWGKVWQGGLKKRLNVKQDNEEEEEVSERIKYLLRKRWLKKGCVESKPWCIPEGGDHIIFGDGGNWGIMDFLPIWGYSSRRIFYATTQSLIIATG
jgi:hypothetical protein